MQSGKGKGLRASRLGITLGLAMAAGAGVAALSLATSAPAKGAYAKSPWWEPGQGGVMPAVLDFRDPQGTLGVINAAGAVDTKGHPFFTPLGTNGRACVSCHQPSDGMSLSAATVQQRWQATSGRSNFTRNANSPPSTAPADSTARIVPQAPAPPSSSFATSGPSTSSAGT